VWKWLIGMPPQFLDMQLPTAALSVMELQRQQRGWCPTTWHKVLATAMGALNRANLYTDSPVSLSVSGTAEWKDALRAAKKEANAFEASAPKAMSLEQVRRAVSTAPPGIKQQLILAWITASRVGCILQIQMRDVELAPDGKLTVQFRRGKGAIMGGPYTVPSTCPQEWLVDLQQALTGKEKDEFLWPCPSAEARQEMGKALAQHLKTVDPQLEQRSIRRGALQELASKGIDEPTLMTFSGHKSVEMLRRYLEWGRKSHHRTAQAQAAAAGLAGLDC